MLYARCPDLVKVPVFKLLIALPHQTCMDGAYGHTYVLMALKDIVAESGSFQMLKEVKVFGTG